MEISNDNNNNNDDFYLQYISDIHLEFWKNKYPKIEPIKSGKSYLTLLGDIGYPHSKNYEDFLKYHSELFVNIFIVSGNHEYYTSKKKQYAMNEIEDKIRNVCSNFPNVIYLQKSSFKVQNTLFLGCTFWTNLELCNNFKHYMNDYNNIYIKNEDISYGRRYNSNPEYFSYGNKKEYIQPFKEHLEIHHIQEKHLEMKSWLFNEIENNQDKNIIVLTHHPPTFKMLEDHNLIDQDGLLKYFYASDLDEEIKKYTHIDYWLCGHTHLNKDIMIGDLTEVKSNCMGYKSESIKSFDIKKYILLSKN